MKSFDVFCPLRQKKSITKSKFKNISHDAIEKKIRSLRWRKLQTKLFISFKNHYFPMKTKQQKPSVCGKICLNFEKKTGKFFIGKFMEEERKIRCKTY